MERDKPKEMEAEDRVINQLTDKPTKRSSERHKARQKYTELTKWINRVLD